MTNFWLMVCVALGFFAGYQVRSKSRQARIMARFCYLFHQYLKEKYDYDDDHLYQLVMEAKKVLSRAQTLTKHSYQQETSDEWHEIRNASELSSSKKGKKLWQV